MLTDEEIALLQAELFPPTGIDDPAHDGAKPEKTCGTEPSPHRTDAGEPRSKGSTSRPENETAFVQKDIGPAAEGDRDVASKSCAPERAQKAEADDVSWVSKALAEEVPYVDPIESFTWIKRVPGFTARHDHPKLGKVLVIAYVEVVTGGTEKLWFNCSINGAKFFATEALATYERSGDAGRLVIKLLAWEDGTTVRRWCRAAGVGSKDDPRHAMTLVVREQDLVRK